VKKMPNKILHNPEERIVRGEAGNEIKRVPTKDVLNYRIEEAELDQYDNPIIDDNTGRPKWTGNTLEWSLRVGETAEFPAYVADYLKKIFPWLEEKEKPKEEVKPAKAQESGSFVCKHCGKALKTKRGLGLHIGASHPDEII